MSELDIYTTVKARSWPRLAGETSHNLIRCSLLARKRQVRIGWPERCHRPAGYRGASFVRNCFLLLKDLLGPVNRVKKRTRGVTDPGGPGTQREHRERAWCSGGKAGL